MDKKLLSERDICTKFITPALESAGWDKQRQILEEVFFPMEKIKTIIIGFSVKTNKPKNILQ